VGVDETGHDDHAAPINLVRVDRTEIGPHGADPGAVDQNVAIQMLPDGGVHRQDDGVANDGAIHFWRFPGFLGRRLK